MMALQRDNPVPNVSDIGLGTNDLQAGSFIRVQTAGMRDLAASLLKLSGSMGPDLLARIVREASTPIREGYRFRAELHEATGNLAKSVKTKTKKYDGAAVAITGPEQTGNRGADNDRPSGNHAWLVEFGTPRRRPGTANRRTYVNVHQKINGKMRTSGTLNDKEFASRGRGYYFLMGSLREPTRQNKRGSGYSHDFMSGMSIKGIVPMTLKPGETYGGMPKLALMEQTINQRKDAVLSYMKQRLTAEINARQRGA